MFINCMSGLGDAIYTRPIVEAHLKDNPDLVVRTTWPQIFADLAPCIPSNTQLRTQKKNRDTLSADVWHEGEPTPPQVRPRYGPNTMKAGVTILGAMENSSGVRLGPSPGLSFPYCGLWANTKPIAVVRPVTVRSEWVNVSRNPDPVYVERAAQILADAGFHVVSIADIDPDREDLIGNPLFCHERYDHGELALEPLLSLMQSATVVVGAVGFVVPMCLAMGTPLICIQGGNGGHNAPELIVDPRVRSDHIRFLMPDNYCRCAKNNHPCSKSISFFPRKFIQALDAVGGLAAVA